MGYIVLIQALILVLIYRYIDAVYKTFVSENAGNPATKDHKIIKFPEVDQSPPTPFSLMHPWIKRFLRSQVHLGRTNPTL
jgi:hypothetical protein